MKKLLLTLALIIALPSVALAQKTKAALTTEVNTNLPSGTGNITAAALRTTLIDILNSYYDLNGTTTLSCAAHNWIAALPTLSSITCTQPAYSDITGNVPISAFNGGIAASSSTFWRGDGTWAAPSLILLPTTQSLTSGTGATYTTGVQSSQRATWIEVFMCGGGGGGGGASTGTAGTVAAGSDGTASTFNAINANPGKGAGTASSATNGAVGGGGGTGGTGAATRRARGGPGGGGLSVIASNPTGYTQGGQGGSSYFGGGAQVNTGAGSAALPGTAGDANSCAGGSGSSAATNSNFAVASGGGAGEFVYLLITNPSATYTYTIGPGGAGGVGTTTGGLGGSGFIFVIEHYGS